MEHRPGGGQMGSGGSALDMGTGSGVGAIFAARRGYRVVAVDINPQAVRCARINTLLNRLEERIEVRRGDLFEPVRGERFDLVLFNPPFFVGEPRSDLDRAWRGREVLERFAPVGNLLKNLRRGRPNGSMAKTETPNGVHGNVSTDTDKDSDLRDRHQ